MVDGQAGFAPFILKACGVALGLGLMFGGSSSGLSSRTEADRIVLSWSGTVDGKMVSSFDDALARYARDRRPIRIELNSGGGNVGAGKVLIERIKQARKTRRIDTVVARGALCASMCVPVYLAGEQRFAHKDARFMFHELAFNAQGKRMLKEEFERSDLKNFRTVEGVHKEIIGTATDSFFVVELEAPEVNHVWLGNTRVAIQGGKEVWVTGKDLVRQESGIVQSLIE